MYEVTNMVLIIRFVPSTVIISGSITVQPVSLVSPVFHA